MFLRHYRNAIPLFYIIDHVTLIRQLPLIVFANYRMQFSNTSLDLDTCVIVCFSFRVLCVPVQNF